MRMILPSSSIRQANTLIEIMVVIVIVTVGIVGTYALLGSGSRLAASTQNRIQAIGMAREGMESVQNIRDTNWLRFSSDTKNCFATKDYNPSCIGNPSNPNSLYGTGYVLIRNNDAWYLTGSTTGSGIAYDGSGYLTQNTPLPSTPCTGELKTNCIIRGYTRSIDIIDPGVDPAAP